MKKHRWEVTFDSDKDDAGWWALSHFPTRKRARDFVKESREYDVKAGYVDYFKYRITKVEV